MAMKLAVSYTQYYTSSREQTGNIITFAQFEKGVYYLELIMILKLISNIMTVEAFHH